MAPALPRPGYGPGSRYVARAATTRTRAPARVPLAALASRLTSRDHWLVRMVHEHRVLTTGQMHRLAFSARRRAQRRLLVLHRLGLLDSFRPLTTYGSSPEHYTLGSAGAALLAAHADCAPKALGWRPTHTARIAFSPSLGHDLATNDLLTLLAAHRHTRQAGLTLWLSERSCTRRWGDLVRPGGYAHWSDGNRVLPFFLEYDTGSENLARVEANSTPTPTSPRPPAPAPPCCSTPAPRPASTPSVSASPAPPASTSCSSPLPPPTSPPTPPGDRGGSPPTHQRCA
ncbi:replication-relaxation family protein [Streptomyces sp. B15]|uniref:replication-relaxation family protein n=1 Tax=Streptomyces sp. B15 TaxID=1537797 RepID=UPI001FFC411F|nr:replication-relaxation family protein [Streptomyces sp. B15]